MSTTSENLIRVACADCPHCGKENVTSRVSERRTGFDSTAERVIACKHCDKSFTLPECNLQIRIKPVAEVDAEYDVQSLTWEL
jgi:hypothetical protein